MKVTVQLRAVLEIDHAVTMLNDREGITDADIDLVFVLPYRGMEICCSNVNELLEGARLILKEVIEARVQSIPGADQTVTKEPT